jgi:hypothetical protein
MTRCGLRVGRQPMQHPAVGCFGRVGMGADVDQAVEVGWATAEEAAFGRRLCPHGGSYSYLDPVALGLGQPAEKQHHHVVGVAVGVDSTADLRHPKLDAVVDEQWKDEAELVAVEHAVRLPDHHRLEAAARVAEGIE